MKLSFQKHKFSKTKRLDLTPLIDVVFLLLIFFLLTSDAVIQAGIRVELPNTISTSVLPTKRVEIYITSNNVVYYKDDVQSSASLLAILTKSRAEFSDVLIYADTDCRHGKVVEIEDICRRSGFRSITVATNPIQDSKE